MNNVPKTMAHGAPGPTSSEISHLCEISDLLLFVCYFASQNEEMKFGNYIFH